MTERLSSGTRVPSWVRYEHQARYEFAASYTRGKTVVDAACGTGIGSALFERSGAVLVEAFDVSERAVSEARSLYPSPKLRFRRADCAVLPLPDHFADIFISLETLEHLPSDGLFLEEAARVLKPEGLFICSTPNRRVTNPGTGLQNKPRNPFHLREYDRRDFLETLRKKFSRIELFGQNRRPSWQSSFLDAAGRWLPRPLAARTPLIFKLPWLLRDALEKHRVSPVTDDGAYDYWVAVCSP